MIRKKTCVNCEEKVKNSFNFCPNCGTQLRPLKENYGLLGKTDNRIPEKRGFIEGMGDKMMDKMISSAFRMVEKEFGKGFQKQKIQPMGNVRLMINGKEVKNKNPKKIEKNTKFLPIEFSEENLKKYRTLPKTEPSSNLKRVENKIKYEIEIPEVESIKDISIMNLENSLEIKAVGKTKSYNKTISIDLPLRKYSLLKGILTLELDTTELIE